MCHSIIHQHLKFQMNRANNNIVIGFQSSLSHIHLPLFEDEKEESVQMGGVYFHKKSAFASERDVEQTYEDNT